MSGSYLAKVRHVYKYHKISFISVYDIAEVQLIYIYIFNIYLQAKVRLDKSETVGTFAGCTFAGDSYIHIHLYIRMYRI